MAIIDDIESQDHAAIVQAARTFLYEVGRVYGVDESVRIWEGLGEVMDTNIKNAVFMDQLVNPNGNLRVYFKFSPAQSAVPLGQRNWLVATIKAIRAAGGYSLKDAKDIYDIASSSNKEVAVTATSAQAARDFRNTMRDLGYVVM